MRKVMFSLSAETPRLVASGMPNRLLSVSALAVCLCVIAGAYAESAADTGVVCTNASKAPGAHGFVVVPFVVYAPETDAALTLSALCHFRYSDEARGPSVIPLYLAYSQRE
jgi:hypothetical protein